MPFWHIPYRCGVLFICFKVFQNLRTDKRNAPHFFVLQIPFLGQGWKDSMGLSVEQREKLLIALYQKMNLPRYVYKYRAFDVNSISSLVKDALWFSCSKQFNDPFESKLRPPLDAIKANIESCGVTVKDEELKQLGLDYLSIFKPLQDNEAICCFSQEPDNILLWTHYGQEHKGFCLQFDIYKDIEFFCPLLPVIYKHEYAPAVLTEKPGEILEQLYQRKSKEWSYEKEVRVIKEGAGLKAYRRESLIGVYFGCRTSTEDKETIRELLKTDVKYYQIGLSESEYRLEVK